MATDIFDKLLRNCDLNGLRRGIKKRMLYRTEVPVILSKFNEAGLLLYVNDVVPGIAPARRIGDPIANLYPGDFVIEMESKLKDARDTPRKPVGWESLRFTRHGEARFYHELVYMTGEYTLFSTLSDFKAS